MRAGLLRKALTKAPFEAIVLTSEVARRYATGFPSSAGAVYLSEKQAVFFTDFRYFEAAKQAVSDFAVVQIPAGASYSEKVNELILQDGVQSVALEEESLTHAAFLRWQDSLEAEILPLGDCLDELRICKDEGEVESIVAAQRIAERALTEVLNEIKVGVTEQQIAARLTYLMRHFGAENNSFDPIVVSGANSANPHGVPSEKPFAAGDFITMDFGCVVNGYCSDMTRTVALSHITDKMQTVYDTVLSAQLAGIAVCKAGVTGCDIDSAGRTVIEKAGFGEAFGHGFGHGVGLEIHEQPTVSQRGTTKLCEGNIITAEPGIYLAGEFGVRIEDMLLVLQDGCVNLTEAPKGLLIL